ncbi:hypothetical protein [Reyranella sp.]|uniref:hypothetical protein n=1 Tax=Reyranella sp. TaxID=1929291 RepID=UPI003782D25A
MADVINESVALELMKLIARSEGRRFAPGRATGAIADRQWILRTYAQCLQAIRRPASVDKLLAIKPARRGDGRR